MEGFFIFVGITVVVGVIAYNKAKKDRQVNSYPIDKVSVIKMQADNCSASEKQKRMLLGYYNKDENHPY